MIHIRRRIQTNSDVSLDNIIPDDLIDHPIYDIVIESFGVEPTAMNYNPTTLGYMRHVSSWENGKYVFDVADATETTYVVKGKYSKGSKKLKLVSETFKYVNIMLVIYEHKSSKLTA